MAQERTLTFKKLVQFHEAIANAHNDINGFYRFNWNEIQGRFRSGVDQPAMLLESYSSDIEENSNATTNFNNRAMSFMIIKHAGKIGDFDTQDQVLDDLEQIALDIITYLKKEHKNMDGILFGMIENGSISYEKVGPIFDNFYGWNVLYTLKNHEPMCYDESKWTWPDP